jgi:outer membrane protein TolC
MVMLGQEFPGRGKRAARVALAEKVAAVTGSALAVRELDLSQRVRKAYVDLQLARTTIVTYRATVDLLRQIADVAEAKYATGRIGQQDLLQAILERSRLEEQILAAEEQGRMAEAALNVLRNRPADDPIGPVDPLAPEVPLPAARDLQRLASESQPELAAIDADVARREAAQAIAALERKPDYVVQGGFMVMPDETNAWTARVGVTWPRAPWARGRIDAMETAAAAQVDAVRAEREATANGLRLAVQEAWIRADSAARRAALLQSSVVGQAGHALDVSRVAYQSDRVDLLVVLDNERRLLEARLNVHRALAARDSALADLARAVGRDSLGGTHRP